MLACRDPIFRDLDLIARVPSAITRRESPMIGELRADMRSDISSQDGGGFTITRHEEPIATLTHILTPSTFERPTSFMCKQSFWDLGARAVRFMRQCVLAEFAKYSADIFVANTYSDHPQLGRWFIAIGLCPTRNPKVFIGGHRHVQKVV